MSLPVPLAAILMWTEIREIQARADGEPDREDARKIHRLVAGLRTLLAFDRHVEPHRIRPDRELWRWLYLPENLERYAAALRIADALDAAVAEAAVPTETDRAA